MRPTIVAGERVRIAIADHPRRAEIWAVVNAEGNVVVHRFVRKGVHGYVFRGDSVPGPDRPVGIDALVGRVDLIEGESGSREPTRWTSSARAVFVRARYRLRAMPVIGPVGRAILRAAGRRRSGGP